MDESPRPAPRLNLFALPSRTTLLFILIVIVIYVPLVAALVGNTPVCMPFLLFWMVLLPLRHFLRDPKRVLAQKQMTVGDATYPTLTQAITDAAQNTAHIQTPRVMLSPHNADGAWAFGTFRRVYLGFSSALAHEIERLLGAGEAAAKRGRAIVLHELAHFRHNDVWLASLARSVLVVTIGFMSLALLVHLLTPFLYYRFLTFFDFTQPPFSELLALLARDNPDILKALDPENPIVAARWLDYELYIITAFVPLIVGSGLLLLFFWRALLRTRELYADARVVEWQAGDAEPLWEGLWVATTLQAIHPTSTRWREKIGEWTSGIRFWSEHHLGILSKWLATHPSDAQRRVCLDEPHQVYGSDESIALTAGAAVVLLNLNLLSQFFSATLRGPNSVPAFALGFTVISLSLLPRLCQWQGKLRGMLHPVVVVVLVYTAIKLIPQYLLSIILGIAVATDPEILQRALEAFVVGTLPPGFGSELIGLFLENFILRPGILFTFFMPPFLVAYVLLDLWLKRRMLQWFGAQFLAHHSAVILAYVTGILTLLLIFVILPIVDWATIPSAHDPLEPNVLVLMLIVLLFALVHVALFVILDRRYARRCPQCSAHVAGEYILGICCERCGAPLNAWLATHA